MAKVMIEAPTKPYRSLRGTLIVPFKGTLNPNGNNLRPLYYMYYTLGF